MLRSAVSSSKHTIYAAFSCWEFASLSQCNSLNAHRHGPASSKALSPARVKEKSRFCCFLKIFLVN